MSPSGVSIIAPGNGFIGERLLHYRSETLTYVSRDVEDRVSAFHVLHLTACSYVPKGVGTFMNCEARKKKRQRRKSAPGKRS